MHLRPRRPRTAALTTFLLGAAAVGCAGPKTYTFDVSVTNRLSEPVTVWITKNHGPFEAAWVPPEMIAANSAVGAEKSIGGVVIDPGNTAGTKVSAAFEEGNYAIVRVYRATGFDNLLAIGKNNPRRNDVTLVPGVNHVVVSDVNGTLNAEDHTGGQ